MKNVLILILLTFLVIFNSVLYELFKNSNIIEGYESLESCIEQGYPRQFCMNVPIQSCIHNCPK